MLVMTYMPAKVFAAVSNVTGIYREYKNFDVFWPCKRPVPLLVLLRPAAKKDIEKFLKNKRTIFIRVVVEILEEKTRGLDGTAVIHKVLDVSHNLTCSSVGS